MVIKNLVSVIVPVYNITSRDENALERCLDSLKAQSCRDAEFLLIDDGSTDDSGAVCDQYAADDSRFVVFHTENQGLCKARNYGLDNARGEYVFFSDADDIVHPQCLEIMRALLVKHPECDTVKGLRAKYDYNDIPPFEQIQKPDYIITDKEEAFRITIRHMYGVWNRMTRHSIIKNERFVVCRHEDFDYSCRIIVNSRKCIFLKNVTYQYIQYSRSLKTENAEKNYVKRLQTIRRVYRDTVKTKAPPLSSEILWCLYYNWIEMYHLTSYKKELRQEMERIKAETWKDTMHSNLPISKKMLLCILIRYPSLATFKPFQYLRRHFNLFRFHNPKSSITIDI